VKEVQKSSNPAFIIKLHKKSSIILTVEKILQRADTQK